MYSAERRKGLWERNRSRIGPPRQLGWAPRRSFRRLLWGFELRQIGTYYAEMIVYPRKRRVIDSVCRREKMFGVGSL